MAKEDRAPASQDKVFVNEDRARKVPSAADQRREADLAEATADLAVQSVYLEAARRTGWSLSEAEDNMKQLREKGDYFDEKGRWTLDTAGWPVCLEGWKPEKKTEAF